jgi:putative transposase
MLAVKSVKQGHRASPELLSLLEDFRLMVNDCVRIGLKEKITSMKKLSAACYKQLAAYDLPTCYRLTAISRAAGILRNYRKNPGEKPYAKRLVLIDCYGFRVFGRLLRLPYRKSEYIFIVLNDHTLKCISGFEQRSITLTPDSVSICYSKEVAEMSPKGAIGIDRNLDNVTTASSDGSLRRCGLSEATRVKQVYRVVKRSLKRNDVRIRRAVFNKYGRLQRNHVGPILHGVSSSVVREAKEKQFAIVMEKLVGIRKLYRRGNGQGRYYRGRMNSWSYFELQRQIEYKARWEGIPVIYVTARGTSATCSMCGSKTYPNGHRALYCQKCNVSLDRDENAARNILVKGGVRFTPDGSPGEAMVQEREQKQTTPILQVDVEKVTARGVNR